MTLTKTNNTKKLCTSCYKQNKDLRYDYHNKKLPTKSIMVTAYFSKFYVVSNMKFVFLSLWHLWVKMQREQNYITRSYSVHKIKQKACNVSGYTIFLITAVKAAAQQHFPLLMLVGPCVTGFNPPVTLFVRLRKLQAVQTFESVDEILWCDHSNESYWTVLSCGTVYYAVQGGSNFWVCGWNPMVWPLKWKLLNSTFLWYCLLCSTRWF